MRMEKTENKNPNKKTHASNTKNKLHEIIPKKAKMMKAMIPKNSIGEANCSKKSQYG